MEKNIRPILKKRGETVMKKKLLAAVISTALTVAALTGCGSAAGAAAAEATTQTQEATESTDAAQAESDGTSETSDDVIEIKACFAIGMTGAVNRFAIEKGLYEQEGIKFDITDYESNDTTLSLITRGDIDVADGDPSTYIPAIQNGVPAKLVGNMWRYQGCYWLVVNDSIQSFEDLKGKTIGTAGASGGMKLSVLKMLEANGISEDEVTLVANGAYTDAYATLTSGEVDATIIHNPYAVLAKNEGKGHSIGRAWDYIPDYYTGTIIASDRIINDEPEKLQRFVTAYYKVHEEVKNQYFDEFIDWAAKYMNTEPALLKEAVESEIDVWSDYPVIPEDRLQKTVEYLQQYGWLDSAISPEGTYTNEFAQKAADELGLKNPEN